MVRGRRVRAVVACARNDDCCSPNPKRKDQKASHKGALSHSVLSTNKTITEFFQAVEIDDPKHLISDSITITTALHPVENSIRSNLESHNNEDLDFETDQIVPTTPVIMNKSLGLNTATPPTPHRIEFCAEVVDVSLKVMKKPDPPKARKRLNINEDIYIKSDNVILAEKINHTLSDYFPVRRSVRKTKKMVLEEKQRSLEQMLRSGVEDGLEICVFEEKGRGVVASKHFQKGDFVVEYRGDLIDCLEAKRRDEKYAQDQNTGCYMYYFKHNDQQYCIDATAESGKIGRLVNHSRNGNLLTRTIMVDGKPRLVLIAKDDIKVGEEVLYDYGDRSKESLRHHPWLAN